MTKRFLILLMAMGCAAFGLVTPAAAQATRTWVSGVGDDANPCSRTAPCKTFAGAISKTAAGGEINALDPGGYGTVTITKSMTIVGTGTQAGILSSSTNGVIINAGATDKVVLKDIEIEGAGTGLTGVKVLSAESVVLDHVVVHGVRGAPGIGLQVVPTTNFARVFVRNSIFSHNTIGISVDGSTAGARVTVENSALVSNTDRGLLANGSNGIANITSSVFTFNNFGFSVTNNGKVNSMGDNVVYGNTTSQGVPTSTQPKL